MTKDKKKKKKSGGKKGGGSSSGKGAAAKALKNLQSLSQNPLVADVVAAALVATASALKDSNKARRLASEAGDELEKMSKEAADQGNAMWDLALEIGRRSLEALVAEMAPKR